MLNSTPEQRLKLSDVILRYEPQQKPVPNKAPWIKDLIAQDIKYRARVGLGAYGTYLQPHNGRDALRDAYEEALDLAQYLRQAMYERDGR